MNISTGSNSGIRRISRNSKLRSEPHPFVGAVGHYQRYGWYKESVDRENAFLLDALRQTDAEIIRRDIDGFRKLRAERHARMRRELAPEAVGAERVYETMEGTARYIEFPACPGGYDLNANDGSTGRTYPSICMPQGSISSGCSTSWGGGDYKTRLFDEGLALDGFCPNKRARHRCPGNAAGKSRRGKNIRG